MSTVLTGFYSDSPQNSDQGTTYQQRNNVLIKPIPFDTPSPSFTRAWKKGVELLGNQWFVDEASTSASAVGEKCIPKPNVLLLGDALDSLGGADALFFSLMVGFYSTSEGKSMLRRCNFSGLADLACLDATRRQVICDLILHSGI